MYAGQSFSQDRGGSETKQQPEQEAGNVEGEYFESYGTDFEVHRVMLEDQPRMSFYRTFLMDAKNVQGKVVIEVGAGTGVLSCWAAKGGALKVVSIEASQFAQSVLRGVIQDNNLGDIVSIVPKRVEAFTNVSELWAAAGLSHLFPNAEEGKKGDGEDAASPSPIEVVLVSEWMGFYLLHEGMLNSVLYARDLLLRASSGEEPLNVQMFPSHADISVAPISLAPFVDHRFQRFWRDSTPNSEINLGAVGRAEAAQYFASVPNPMIEVLPADCLLSDPKVLWSFDLMVTTEADLRDLTARPSFSFKRAERKKLGLGGFCLWFSVSGGSVDPASGKRLTLDTSPTVAPTHWKQSTVLLPEEIRSSGGLPVADLVNPGASTANTLTEPGDKMGIAISLTQEASGLGSRCYEIDLDLFDPSEEE